MIAHLSALALAAAAAAAPPAPPKPPVSISLGAPMRGLDDAAASFGDQTGRFAMDSGGGVSLVTPAFAARLGCLPWGKITGFRATGQRIDMQRCKPVPLAVGGAAPSVLEPAVFDIAALMGPNPPPLSGLIALDAFAGRTVTLSVSGRRWVVETAASRARIAASGVAVPIRLVRDAQGAALTVDVGAPTSKGLLWLEIDTGNSGPSLVDAKSAALLGLDPAKARGQVLDAPLAGAVRLSGPVQVGDFIMDGNLGRAFLKSWDVTLDLEHGRGWLTPAGPAAAPAEGAPPAAAR